MMNAKENVKPPIPPRSCLVTGGSRGIGRAICLELARSGCRVGVHFHTDAASAEAVLAEIIAEGGAGFTVQADLASQENIDVMMTKVRSEFGGLDVLVNNAGWENVHHAIDLPLSDFRHALDVNLVGPFLCSQGAARMMEASGGVIVNNLSIHDTVPRKGLAHYCSSKAAMLMLTRCLALEWAEYGIRVVGVSPGAIETDMNRKEIESFGREHFESAIPAGRIGNVEEVAKLVSFLASDAAGYITGTTVYTDGGYMQTRRAWSGPRLRTSTPPTGTMYCWTDPGGTRNSPIWPR
ncbi:MAG: SDR family oxidoreductase [Kiritimatiellia bacterium]